MTANDIVPIVLHSLISNSEFLCVWNKLESDRKYEVVNDAIQTLTKIFEKDKE